jgi:MoaA/NifB/PqqE/SkfB family radical SAM enzyme
MRCGIHLQELRRMGKIGIPAWLNKSKEFYKRASSFIRYRILFRKTIPMWSSVTLELGSLCNRDCWFCNRFNDRTGVRKREDGHKVNRTMPTWKILQILKELVATGYRGAVVFSGYSEPTLDSRLVQLAAVVRRMGLSPKLRTNGDLIRQRGLEYSDQLSEAFDEIVFGQYDYANEEERSSDFLEMTYKLRKAKRIDTSIKFQNGDYLVPEFNIDEQKFISRYGCSRSDWNKAAIEMTCPEPLKRLVIRYDGEVGICCVTDLHSIGNLYAHTLQELWWGKDHVRFVRDLRRKGRRRFYEPCNQCYYGGDYPKNIRDKIEAEVSEKKDYFLATPKWIDAPAVEVPKKNP